MLIIIPQSIFLKNVISYSRFYPLIFAYNKFSVSHYNTKNPILLPIPDFLCGKRDLNPHVVANTRSLVQPVCQFQHSRISNFKEFIVRKMGLEPTRANAHKNLNLARLPIPTLPHTYLFNSQSVFYMVICKKSRKN